MNGGLFGVGIVAIIIEAVFLYLYFSQEVVLIQTSENSAVALVRLLLFWESF